MIDIKDIGKLLFVSDTATELFNVKRMFPRCALVHCPLSICSLSSACWVRRLNFPISFLFIVRCSMETEDELIREKFFNLKVREDVAELLEISDRSLRYFLYKRRPENMYQTFVISKRNGTKREISAPQKELKEIQRKLANILTLVYMPKICAYGFIKGKDHAENAKRHLQKRLIFNIDLKDFFHQIHFGRVRGMLMKAPYSIQEEAATVIAQIACYRGHLPQGAPTSPILTNMICTPLDNALMRLAKNTGCIYTRYADDITFSTYKAKFDIGIVDTSGYPVRIGNKLVAVLEKHSFSVNPEKIALKPCFFRQEVTGLTVNEFLNVRRSYVKQLRALLHSSEKYGLYAAAKVYIEKGLCKSPKIYELANDPRQEESIISWFQSVLKGKILYIKHVKGKNSLTYLTMAEKFNHICERNIFDVRELHRFENAIKNSTFILQSELNGNYIQGSGFYLAAIGLFTSYHVTESGAFFDVFTAEKYDEKRSGCIGKELNEIASDSEIDYAVYRLPFAVDVAMTFECGDSKRLKVGDQVTIIGYPNHQKGNSAFIQTCSITSSKFFHGALFFTVSGRVVHGASGGMVLNPENEVVGILKGGIINLKDDDENENQGFIPIHLALEHMKTVTLNKN